MLIKLLFIDECNVVANALEAWFHLSEVHDILPIVRHAAFHLFLLLNWVIKIKKVIEAEVRTLKDYFLRINLLALKRVAVVSLHKSIEQVFVFVVKILNVWVEYCLFLRNRHLLE